MTLVRIALAGLMLLASEAHGATTCLTDPFTLEDQRALAAVRAATEATCPCDAARASGHRRCARAVLDAALADGSLRSDCSRTARKVLRGSSCGTDLTPCGSVRERDGAAACRLRPAERCTSSAASTRSACSDETHCTDVVEWSAGTCLDPRAAGPFAPGHRIVTYTKDSVVSPGTPRVLETSIWYPAPPGSGPISAASGGVDGAALDPSGGPYPLVLFSHGSCGVPRQSKFLTPLLASHGFIVVAPPHPGNTFAEFPDCQSGPALLAALSERPQDIVFALEQILAADQDPGSFFFGAIDEDRIGMSGHSFGGLTTYLVAAIEPRIDAAVAMAPAALADSMLAVPSLTILGALDSVVSNPAARDAYARSSAPKWLVEIQNTGHFAFSDFCFPTSDCNPPVTLTSEESHDAALRYVLPFLHVHVAGDPRWEPLLGPPTRPGFTYTASPDGE